MYNRLKTYSVHPTLIGLTVDIATGITVCLAEDELEGKQEVAKWALEMIQVSIYLLFFCGAVSF